MIPSSHFMPRVSIVMHLPVRVGGQRLRALPLRATMC